MSIAKIVLLNLWILAAQAFYMYLSNKNRLKSDRYLYLIAAPIAAAFPAVIGSQDIQAYSLYEYAVVFLIIFAAVADISAAASFNREFLTETEGMSLTLSYFLICTVTAFYGDVSVIVRIAAVFLPAGAFLVFSIKKKRSLAELLKSMPLAAAAIILSWLLGLSSFGR